MLEAFLALWNVIKGNLGKVAIVFVLGGIVSVLGLVPGTENVSNVVGGQITSIKTTIGTAASPTIVQ